ncbi:Uncharacterized protein Fot_24481 [Forsythia ovata]|uniref:Uncharacterized protein n=1 Tax=Forsythia ovata TaxID=205694 RepID=A0ABD1U6D1_9LAMI
MSATKASTKKRVLESDNSKSESRQRVIVYDDFDVDISNDIKGIMSALKQIKEKAHKNGQKKNEETISSANLKGLLFYEAIMKAVRYTSMAALLGLLSILPFEDQYKPTLAEPPKIWTGN